MNRLLKLFGLALLFLLPGFAFAGVLKPPGGTDWDMYVYGNARVIYDVLNSVKLLINPDAGSSAFKFLLYLLATIGFIVLAVSAGFDPSKNFMKMFTYIFTVWFLSYATTGLTVNVVLQDQSRSAGMLGTDPVYRIDKVPALVAMPAILTSQIGKYFTTAIETNFTLPDELKMSGAAVGQYNLFGKMTQESSQYIITSPELKHSVSQYVTDCVVPAIAMGTLKGDIPGDTAGTTTQVSGTAALLKSQNLWQTLGTARNKSIITKYYPYDMKDTAWIKVAGGEVDDLRSNVSANNATYMASGVLVSCDSAYAIISQDIVNYAALMVTQGAEAWSRAGVMVPFQTAFQTMLTEGGMTGTSGQPSGYIMQTAMINTMNGSFRQAAAQTGNSAMLTAAQLAQAEQSQWSAWSAGFSTFNNMMGYVFTVLQAFIFAITPLIIVALFIPGMGKAIFVNYSQILVWLTLWMPMLAVINFLITLYGSDAVSGALGTDGGPSMHNRGIMAQAVNHQMLAAQFLGGMVPMISWGIVKGAMAFTEFINHGIGNQFAAAAGAGAATGNMSLNNMSMDNTSMNKFSTMSSSQVGYQGVSMGVNAGTLLSEHNLGGQKASMNGGGVNIKEATQNTLQKGITENTAMTNGLSHMTTRTMSASQLMSDAAGSSKADGRQQAASTVIASMLANSSSFDASQSKDAGIVRAWQENQQVSTTGGNSTKATMSGDLKAGVPGIGPTLAVGASLETSQGHTGGVSSTASEAGSDGTRTAAGANQAVNIAHNKQVADALSRIMSSTHDAKSGFSSDKGTAFQEAVSSSLAHAHSIGETLSAGLSVATSMDYSQGVGLSGVKDMTSTIDGLQKSMGGSTAGLQDSMAGQLSKLGSVSAGFNQSADQRKQDILSHLSSAQAAAGHGPGGQAAANTKFNAQFVQAGKDLDTARRSVDARSSANGSKRAGISVEAKDRVNSNGPVGAALSGARALLPQ